MRATLLISLSFSMVAVGGCCLGSPPSRAATAATRPAPPAPTPEERRAEVAAAASAATQAPLDDAGHLAEAERLLASDATSATGLDLEDFGAVGAHLDALPRGFEAQRVRAARRALALLERERGQMMVDAARSSIRTGDFTTARALVADIPADTPSARQQAPLLHQIERAEAHEAAMSASRGPRPERIGGTPVAVYSYLRSAAHNPDSIEIESCSANDWTQERGRECFWTIDCLWRGQNGFGAIRTSANRFFIQNGRVMRTETVSHPR